MHTVKNNPAYRVTSCSYDLYKSGIQQVRQRVFVEEQGIDPRLEWDEHDASAVFAVALDQDYRVIGTGRLLPQGKIGRMAVLPEYRLQGVGSALLEQLLQLARQCGHSRVMLAAQQSVIGFYKKHGFESVGPPHSEAGIPHQNMQHTL
jgi:predicted GNAT family N-acyltransferase